MFSVGGPLASIRQFLSFVHKQKPRSSQAAAGAAIPGAAVSIPNPDVASQRGSTQSPWQLTHGRQDKLRNLERSAVSQRRIFVVFSEG